MSISKWAVGSAYGPVLTSTELYLLQAADGCKGLELNPILNHSLKSFHLVFNLANGGYDNADPDKDLAFTQGDQPATIPRVSELYVIAKISPWVATVTASQPKRGVTLGDVINCVWSTYGENTITEAEWSSLGVREQERVKRASVNNQINSNPSMGWNGGYPFSPSTMDAKNFRRSDWLRDKIFFDGIEIDDEYAVKRLGFKAPNVFVMSFCG
ncbi:uncharacterized protein EI90DRAFT_1480556 [Cantharellus anzutake]|uniref:uncharacterized protein n=1 Tax=Cantharellus anzutake TaxID=1750568 RepID=UPI001905EE08|nr:uncharacterized protein EI90DRAFT_1480556 [Cantharellus anzutake]KAF8328826.1 hypothetical protein EI90DRAFT_1480556 [Cantharellus anzutake]